MGPDNYICGVLIPRGKGQFWGKGHSKRTFCHELCKKGRNNLLAVLVMDSGGPKEAQVQSCVPGGTNVPT